MAPVGPSIQMTRPSMVPTTTSGLPSPFRSASVGDDSMAELPTLVLQSTARSLERMAWTVPSTPATTMSGMPSALRSATAGLENAMCGPLP
jgi:hypothetical protein